MAFFVGFPTKRGGLLGVRKVFKQYLCDMTNKMGAKTINISMPDEMAAFLFENPTLKPSAIFQTAVENIQNSIKHNPQLIEANKYIQQLQKIKQRLQDNLQSANGFITKYGLWEKYVAEVNVKL